MVVEVRLHIEEEPMLGNGDGGQCAGGTLFTSNHHSTAKLVRQSSLNSISHQRQVQLTLTPHCSLGSTIKIDSGSGRQGRLTGTDEVSEGSSALDGVSMLAPGISHWVVESHATICCRKRQHLQLEIIGLVLRHSGDQLSANRTLQRLHVVPCRRHGALDKCPTVPQTKDIGSVSCVGLSGSNIREAIHLSDPSSYLIVEVGCHKLTGAHSSAEMTTSSLVRQVWTIQSELDAGTIKDTNRLSVQFRLHNKKSLGRLGKIPIAGSMLDKKIPKQAQGLRRPPAAASSANHVCVAAEQSSVAVSRHVLIKGTTLRA